MSTGGFQQTTYPASGETALDTITTNTTDVFGDASDLVDGGTDYAANLGTEIKDRGSGTGQSGGFDVDKHLSFDGDTDYRWDSGGSWALSRPCSWNFLRLRAPQRLARLTLIHI